MSAVVFDLNGVLVDSEPVWEEVRRAFVAGHGGQWARALRQMRVAEEYGEGPRQPFRVAREHPPPDRVVGERAP
jgi:beta-phosphoglucomutase-like phosphatase (HAD superfamily)